MPAALETPGSRGDAGLRRWTALSLHAARARDRARRRIPAPRSGASISRSCRRPNYSDFANRGVALRRRPHLRRHDGRAAGLPRYARMDSRCEASAERRDRSRPRACGGRRLWPGEYGVTSPPAVYRDLVIVGSSVADNSRARMASGEVRAFDAETGALQWTFHPLPGGRRRRRRQHLVAHHRRRGQRPRVPADRKREPRLLRRPAPGRQRLRERDRRAAAPRPARSRGHFQTVHHDLWDYDVASPPMLFAGKSRPRGRRRIEDRAPVPLQSADGKPLLPHRRAQGARERRARASTRRQRSRSPSGRQPGAAADQRGRHLGRDARRIARRACATLPALRNEGVFTPPSLAGSLHVPGNIGGLHWGGDGLGSGEPPDHRARQPPARDHPADPERRLRRARNANPGAEITEQDGAPYSMSRQFFLSPPGSRAWRRRGASWSRSTPTPARSPGARRSATCATSA